MNGLILPVKSVIVLSLTPVLFRYLLSRTLGIYTSKKIPAYVLEDRPVTAFCTIHLPGKSRSQKPAEKP